VIAVTGLREWVGAGGGGLGATSVTGRGDPPRSGTHGVEVPPVARSARLTGPDAVRPSRLGRCRSRDRAPGCRGAASRAPVRGCATAALLIASPEMPRVRGAAA
jgi:hypothetical protein